MREGGAAEIETLSTSMNALFSSLQSSIEQQKEYEAILRESEEKYSTLFRSANDSIFIIRGDRLEDCNTRALEVLGRTREEVFGAPIGILSPVYQPDGQRSADAIREYIRRAYAGESLSFSWEYQTADGTHRNAEITANRFDLRSGAYLLVIGRDITERLEMERLKNEAFGQIEQNLEQFAILNDEIRNPLQVIQAIVEMDSCKEAKSVLTQVEIINDLVNQLDRGYIESEKVREFLKKHYRIGEKK
ncbi:MAG TPA: PAS domain S-box protein [Methanofollis liminatans]|uniref:PAS domain S-box protein n=1 Tax=Methanofollis liminatans TaxID=2201 RepID=A0A831M0W4_9EURY|nr:PAS domain S-box protein [Methanofollis liminatans]